MKTKSNRRHTLAATVGAIVLLLAACQTTPIPQRPARVEALLAELQAADLDRMTELSARPFLLDGEVIVLERDVERMWRNLRDAGFSFQGAAVTDVAPVDGETAAAFGITRDARVWFERYAAEDAGVAIVETEVGTFLVVTGERSRRLPTIAGFTTAPGGGS